MHHARNSRSDWVRVFSLKAFEVPIDQNTQFFFETRTTTGTDCDANDNDNAGCGVQNNKANNYGPAFNSAGGGWYVLWRTPDFMNVYFWSRNDPTVPADVANDMTTVTPTNWVRDFPCFFDFYS